MRKVQRNYVKINAEKHALRREGGAWRLVEARPLLYARSGRLSWQIDRLLCLVDGFRYRCLLLPA
jgi:hypothetical protein